MVLHGNATWKSSQKPYICKKQSVLQKIKKSSLLPKETILAIIKNGGGIEKIRGPFDIAKHWQQVSNTKHRAHTCQDTIVEITDLGQIEKETSKQFIRYVTLVLELSAFVASNQQLNDVERFCT